MSALFINACLRENSRTKILANEYLKKLKEPYTEIILDKLDLLPLNSERLRIREELISDNDLDNPIFKLAHQFAEADEIIIAAPFWDLSFPSLLKIYFENITISGIAFRYDLGIPVGLCKAKKLTYFTTSGGPIFMDFGYEYVKALAKNFYQIEDVLCYRVENLDVKCVEGEGVLKEDIKVIK